MMDLVFDAFVTDCRNVVDGRALKAWPGPLVMASVGHRMRIDFIEGDTAEQKLYELLDGADMAGMCQPIGFDQLPVLFLITVPKHERKPASFLIRHLDGRWERAITDEAPWLALSTAGTFRKFMLTGERSPLKRAEDERLYGNIHMEPPPTDADGNI